MIYSIHMKKTFLASLALIAAPFISYADVPYGPQIHRAGSPVVGVILFLVVIGLVIFFIFIHKN